MKLHEKLQYIYSALCLEITQKYLKTLKEIAFVCPPSLSLYNTDATLPYVETYYFKLGFK